MGLLEECQELFGTSNLYDVIGVPKAASEADVRRGYYKTSLQVHPDRVPDDKQATEKFQALGKVYAVLSDKGQRAVYDEQGTVDDDADSLDRERNWEEYWRRMFPKITLQDILDFEKTYKGSAEEEEDLKRVYREHGGDMTLIMESALCSSYEDEPRVRRLLQGAIDAGELPAHDAFTNESARKKNHRKRKADKERQEAEEMQRDMGLGTDDSLVAMIKGKQAAKAVEFDSFLGGLEAKYCQKKAGSSAARKGKKKK